MTRKLYYENSYIKEFEAKVLECETLKDGKYGVVLNATAFFPEGGGQPADTGALDDARVLDAHERGEDVVHYTDKPLAVGETVKGRLDFERRFRLMQNHSGEHILSGIVNRKYGYDNVGFHMGSEDITVDYSGFLGRDELREIEREANIAVCRNLPIKTSFPSPEELKNIHYRSKKELFGAIRIVEVKDFDICACCAPHLNFTGEVGMIKVLDSIKYKGGVRVHFHCGFDAIDDYNRKYDAVREIANTLSVPQNDVADGFRKYDKEYAGCRAYCSHLKAELMKFKADAIPYTDGNLCLFEDGFDGEDLRKYAVLAAEKCSGVCAVFSGEDGNYNYVLLSRSVDLKANLKTINEALSARGGGSAEMVRGKAICTKEKAEEFLIKKWQI